VTTAVEVTTFSRIRNAALLASLVTVAVHAQTQSDRAFLTWTRQYAESVGRSMRQDGRVGGAFDFRVVHTEHSYNYKLRATWLTPEVIRATARLAQLSGGLSDEETNALIREAELPGATVILVEIDPREGSGVIPLDWVALMRPKGAGSNSNGVRGTSTPDLRQMRALAGVFRRDYAYEQFWVVFPTTGNPTAEYLAAGAREAELVVRIGNKEGRVSWPVPESVTSVAARR
jgi:hypothetical protein